MGADGVEDGMGRRGGWGGGNGKRGRILKAR